MNQSGTRIVTGLAIVAVGLAFLLQALGVVAIGPVLADWWPLLIVFIGLVNLWSTPRQFIWPLFVVGAGVLLQLRNLELLSFNPWQVLWPLAIIAFGLSFIVRPPLPKTQDAGDDVSNSFVAFSGAKVRSASSNYRGGQLSAWFGGIELDLRDAKLKDRARLDMFAAFGGIELRVPQDWTVKVNGVPLFGGWENKTTATQGGPVLEVTGVCMFGGIEIKN